MRLPDGVIPQPERWRPGRPEAHTAETPPAPAPQPATAPPPAPRGGGEPPKPLGKFGQLLAKKKSQASGAAPEADIPPTVETAPPPADAGDLAPPLPPLPPPATAPKKGGEMLAYLQGWKTRAGASDPLARALREAYHALRKRAKTEGFETVYEVLEMKRDLLSRAFSRAKKAGLSEAAERAFRAELDDIDGLKRSSVDEIWRRDPELREIAELDIGGLGGLKKELSGLFKELG